MAIFQENQATNLDYIVARMMEVVVTTRAITYKAPVKSLPAANHQARCPSCHPLNSVRALKGES